MANIFSRIVSWARGKEVTAAWQPLYGAESMSQVTAANLMDNNKNWVYVCVNKIAMSTAGIKFKLLRYKDGDDEEIFDHTAIATLAKPNQYMSGRDLLYSTFSHLELTGNAYWLKDKTGAPTTIFPLNPKGVTVKLSDDGMRVIGYEYRVGTKNFVYAPDLVLHLKYPNPQSPTTGRGILESIAEWVDVDNFATEFNRRFFLNGATFGGVMETESTSKESQEMLRISLDNQHRGVRNAHKWLIMPKGVKAVESKMTPKDMEFSEADMRFRDKILAAFGVPKSVVGIVEDVNRANADSSNYVFNQFTIKPKIDWFINFLNEFYLPLFSGTKNLYFSYEDPTPENTAMKLEENKAALAGSGWKSINEVRSESGLPAIDGGDTVMQPFNLTPIGDVQPVEEEAKSQKKRPPRIDQKEKVSSLLVGKVFDLVKFKATEEEMAKRHKEFIVRVTTYEQKFTTDIKAHDRKQKDRVLDKVRSKIKSKAVTASDLMNLNDEVELMVDFATPLMKALALDEGTRALLLLGLQQEFNPNTSTIRRILEASVKRMAKSYTRTTLDLLVDQINEGLELGEGIDKIADRVSGIYDLTEQYRAERVARTEVFSTANDAAREAYRQSGVVKTVKWRTAEDELVCEFCNAMGKQDSIPVDAHFEDKGGEVQGVDGGSYALDYERLNNPPLHPNCRCELFPDEISVKSVKPVKKDIVDDDDEEWIDDEEAEEIEELLDDDE